MKKEKDDMQFVLKTITRLCYIGLITLGILLSFMVIIIKQDDKINKLSENQAILQEANTTLYENQVRLHAQLQELGNR